MERSTTVMIWAGVDVSLMIEDRNLSYSERLKRLNITTLETRRLRGDPIQVFKNFKGLDNVQHSDFFTMAGTELRGHELKVYKPQVHLDISKYFFLVRLSMHGIVYRLRCNNVENFKRKLDCLQGSGIRISFQLFSLVSHSLWWVVR